MDKKLSSDKKSNSLIIKSTYSYFFLVIFQCIIFFSLFKRNFSVRFEFPKAINLENGNILVIHQLGIEVYDSCFKNLIKSTKTFSSDEKISSESTLSQVSISRLNEETNSIIIAIIINKIYIFDYQGELLYEEESTEIKSLFEGYYYDLTVINKNGNKYKYMIGFVNDEKCASLFFFEYDKDSETNTLIKQMDPFLLSKNGNTYYIGNKGISCQIMLHPENGELLICFFLNQINPNEITATYIDYNSYNFVNISYISCQMNDAKGIKSAVTLDKKTSLVCMYFPGDQSYCMNYTIDDNTFSEPVDYGVLCRDGHFAFNIEYNKAKKEYVISCSNNAGTITGQIFDKNFAPIKEIIKITSGYKVQGASIIYSSILGDYYIISDIISANTDKDSFLSITGEAVDINNITIPTVILTTIPTTILTTIPTTILTTIPTTILTTIPTTILTKIPTTILKSTTTPTTILINEPTTIITAIKETNPYVCNLEKCLECNEESFDENLCITCNTENNYYPISPLIKLNSNQNSDYIDCYNNLTKPTNFYLNKDKKYYEPCYKTCATCNYGGNGNQNNCTKCDIDHIFEPEKSGSTNCVAECTYYYYFSYGQYKCTTLPQCPKEFNLLIKDKKKCVNSCKKDTKYKNQYNGECIEICPEGTIETDNLCKINNSEVCTERTSQFKLYDFLKEGGVEKIVKTYANEFNYTTKHISLYKNDNYSIMLYKEKECISELGLPMPEIDFGICYKKVQEENGLQNIDLIVSIIDKKSSKTSNPITSYAFYNPENGDKLDSEEICKEEVIVVKENIKSILKESNTDINSILFLAGQNIDIFNKSSEFYTNLCYHFDSPCDKDVALRDRLLIYYPNITLCDSGCKNIGVNLSSMMAICECKYKELTDEESNGDANIYEEVVNQVNKILNQVNLAVMECYKDLFQYDYFFSNTGGIIFIIFIFIQVVTLVAFYFSSLFGVSKYIYNVTENFLLYLNKSPLVNNKVINYGNNDEKNDENINNQKSSYPPKKSQYLANDINDKNKVNKIKDKKQNNKSKKKKIIKTQEEFKTNKILSSKQLKKVKKLTPKFNKSKTFDDYLSIPLEDMHFHDVSLTDNRLFFEYFCDKIKKKQLIMQLFYSKNPLKPLTIKILILILDIEICFIVNAMFINEDYVSEIFHSTKKETFISFIPRSINRFIFTVFSSLVVSYFINCLFVEESKIKGVLKRERKDINNLKYQINLTIKEVKIRYYIFIIASFGFSLFSWFYISCFNHIYPHMKLEWIKSTVFIIILIHILSIVIILIETLLRFVSFEIKSEKMYRASLWLG